MDSPQSWLRAEAERQIAGARIVAHDGTAIFCPDGSAHYKGIWVRDFCYMVEGCPAAIPSHEIRAACRYLLAGQRDDGALPDRTEPDGTHRYVVLSAAGDQPPTDNPQFMVKLVWEDWRAAGCLRFFDEARPRLLAALESLPRDPETGLIWVDPAAPHSSYGFTDCIGKTGLELFSSLLLVEALAKFAEMEEASGRPSDARAARDEAGRVRRSIETFWSPADGLYLAASEACRQPDVWGSAYAVWIGAPPPAIEAAICRALTENMAGIVKRGQVRHLAEPQHWQNLLADIKPGTYQNGAYWGTASGWVAAAIAQADAPRADAMLRDLVADYRAGGVWECVNDGYEKCREYVASATLPLQHFARHDRWRLPPSP